MENWRRAGMNKTKIDWADATWNPVTGCLHGCEYCYAKKIAERFGSKTTDDVPRYLGDPMMKTRGKGGINPYPFGFAPTFHAYQLQKPAHWKTPRTIFVGSMADMFGEWVPTEWKRRVFRVCLRWKQHRYLFLTKHPEGIWKDGFVPSIEDNIWYGVSVTRNAELGRISYLPIEANRFISIEPMLEAIDLDARPMKVAVPFADWVIIGAETGKRKKRVIPERRWVEDVTRYAHEHGAKVFMKESLRELMGTDFIQEFPWEV
jgi:protein gp37